MLHRGFLNTKWIILTNYITGLRLALMTPRLALFSRLFLTDARLGLVAIRFFWTTVTHLIRSVKRLRASSLFRFWDLCTEDLMTITPSLFSRRSFMRNNRDLTFSGKEDDATANLNSTALLVLLTLWPPGPDARMAENSISLSGIEIRSDIMRLFEISVLIQLNNWISESFNLFKDSRFVANNQHNHLIEI